MGQAAARLLSDRSEGSFSSRTRRYLSDHSSDDEPLRSKKKPSRSAREIRSRSYSRSDGHSKRHRVGAGAKTRVSTRTVSSRRATTERGLAPASLSGLYSSERSQNARPPLRRRNAELNVSRPDRNRRSNSTRQDKEPRASKSNSRTKQQNTSERTTRSATPKQKSQKSKSRRREELWDSGQQPRDHGPPKDCIVCANTLPIKYFPSRPPTAACTHEVQVCKACLREWIWSEFESKVWDQINCPDCRSRMQYEDIRKFAPSVVFRKYDRLSTKAAFETIPGFRWCTTKGCKSGQVHDAGPEAPIFECAGCGNRQCVVHNRRWHDGETCAEYDYRTDGKQKKAEEQASKKVILETTKKCPGCKWDIEKNYGCDHMTCSRCRHEFCWVCLAPYRPIRDHGNHMHRVDCQYFS